MIVCKGIHRDDQVTPRLYEPTYNLNQLEFIGSHSLNHVFRPTRIVPFNTGDLP
jgi:hypothetical protein